MKEYDHIVIGDGIAAKAIIFKLNNSGQKNILQIANEDFAPACTTRTTGINCLRGTTKGLSTLGDMIVESYNEFEEFNKKFSPHGVTETFEVQTWSNDSVKKPKWMRRFGNCFDGEEFFGLKMKEELNFFKSKAYIIEPYKLSDWFRESSTFEFVKDFVTGANAALKTVSTQNGKLYNYKKLYICTSYLMKSFSSLVKDEDLRYRLMHSKSVAGTYMRFSFDQFSKSFQESSLNESYCFAYEKAHFIVRFEQKDVLIGATHNNMSDSLIPEQSELRVIYELLHDVLKDHKELPSIDEGELLVGIRHKDQKRVPFWGEVNEDIFAVWGLYKNAFTLAFKAANDLVK